MNRQLPVSGQLGPSLRTLLADAGATATALLAHLQGSRQALADADPAAIKADLDSTNALLASLDEQIAGHRALLHRHGYGTDRASLEQAIEACNDAELTSLWQTLRQQLQECRESNRGNARLADTAWRRAREALAILQGETNETAAYGPRGDLPGQRGGHSIARA